MSSETKFSPGPWRTGPINYADVYSAATGELVALVTKGRPETVPDAYLVKAAPELYEALESAAVHLEEMRKDEKWHPVGKCPVLDMVRAALSRARGGADAGN